MAVSPFCEGRHHAEIDWSRTRPAAIAFAWYVWDRNYTGPTIISRISARDGRMPSSTPVTP
jgi:hypothetical protein